MTVFLKWRLAWPQCPDRGTDTAAIWFWGIRCFKCQCNVYWGLATSVARLWWASWGCQVRLRDKKKKNNNKKRQYRSASREGRTFVQKADLTNASCLLVHNLNAGEKPVSHRVYSTQTSLYSSILNKGRRLRRDAKGGRDARELSLPWIIFIRYYPLSQWELYQHWWERLIKPLVRLQHVYTPCHCCKPTRLNY